MNQPDAIVPPTSKIPTSASSPAAVVGGIPWSIAAGMKWVAISPLVVAPQIANPPASSQNVGTSRGVDAAPAARVRPRSPPAGGGGGPGSASVAPYARRPMSAGWLRSSSRTRGTTASAAAAVVSAAVRQPWWVASQATSGRKISCPVALPAVRMPATRPRRATNQRFTTVATNAIDIDPAPTPTSTPQHRTSCQAAVMNTVSPLPRATITQRER